MPALPGFGFGGKPRERGWGVTRIAAAFDALMSVARLRALRRAGRRLGRDHRRQARRRLSRARRRDPRELRDRAAAARRRPGARRRGRAVPPLAHLRGRATRGSSARSPTRSRSPSPTRPPGWPPGSSRSSAPGATATATSSGYFGRDTLLTNLMFYWAPGERRERRAHLLRERARPGRARPARPRRGAGRLRGVPARDHPPPREWVEPHYAIARWTEMPRGGHFAALEEPRAAPRRRARVLPALVRGGARQRGAERARGAARARRRRARRTARPRSTARARPPWRALSSPAGVSRTTERRRSSSERWRATRPRRSSSSSTGTTCAGSRPHSPASSSCDGGASAPSTARIRYWRAAQPERGQRILGAGQDLVAELDQHQRRALRDAAGSSAIARRRIDAKKYHSSLESFTDDAYRPAMTVHIDE